MDYLLALDQGITSSRAIVFNLKGQLVATAHQEIHLGTPRPAWVEQDGLELWNTQIGVAQ